MAPQTLHPMHAEAATSVSGEQSQRYREELEQLIRSRMQPGERALPELKSSPAVRHGAILSCCNGCFVGLSPSTYVSLECKLPCIHLQVQALRSRLAQTEAKIQSTVREAAPSQDSKKEAQELQQLRAQLEESLRNEERLRKQLEEVWPPALHDRDVRGRAGLQGAQVAQNVHVNARMTGM